MAVDNLLSASSVNVDEGEIRFCRKESLLKRGVLLILTEEYESPRLSHVCGENAT